jgi:hypothetical protein
MRELTLFLLMGVVACTRPNADFCCVTQAQCDELGGTQIRPCRAGQACLGGRCVASQCDNSGDCTDPASPVCINNLCVAKCATDDDCIGAPGAPYCASDGACVGCTSNAQCPTSAAFCDAEARTCRGCEVDAECTSGVCLEADGRCTSEAEVVFIEVSGADSGSCVRSAPCATLQYAMSKVSPMRRIVHLGGGSLTLGPDLAIQTSVYIDGSDTLIRGDGSGPEITVDTSGSGPVTFGNVTIATTTGPPISVTASGVRLFNVTITMPVEIINGASLSANASRFIDGGVTCNGGSVTVQRSTITRGGISTLNCQVAISRSTFDTSGDDALRTAGGVVTFENNLVVQSYKLADTLYVGGAGPTSSVRFNTVVNTSTVVSDGVAIYCDSTLDVSSNIFAYGSMHPHGGSACKGKYSLYDTIALGEQTAGEGNKVVDGAMIFANKAGRDFHLAATSAARGAGQPNTGVTTDFDGKRRPDPAGTDPDMGAFEAP